LQLFYKMKKYNYYFILIFSFVSLISQSLFSQEIEEDIPLFKKIEPITVQNSYQFSVRPSYLWPLGGTSSYINKAEFKLINLSFEIIKPSDYSIGIEIGQHYFTQTLPRATYDYDGTLVSATQIRTINNIPLVFNYAKYWGAVDKAIRPYGQIGIGVVNINYKTYWGYILDQKIRYAPIASPAFGVKINLDKSNNWVLDARLKYMIAPFKYDFISKLNYLSLDVSLGFRWWDE
jgi:hypothetical protein